MQQTSKSDVIDELALLFEKYDSIYEKEDILFIVDQRESIHSTFVGHGVAIPHGRSSIVDRSVIALGILDNTIEWSEGSQLTKIVVLLISPYGDAVNHIKVLAKICRLFAGDELINQIINASSPNEVFAIIENSEN